MATNNEITNTPPAAPKTQTSAASPTKNGTGTDVCVPIAGQSAEQPSQSMSHTINHGQISLPAPKALTSSTSLSNLLPTGTVLAFEALVPSFSDDGACHISNKYITAILIAVCTVTCFISSFTDSFTYNGKLYYGIATFKGLYIFNDDEKKKNNLILSNYKIRPRDYTHAFLSAFVFLIFAISNSDVRDCFIPNPGPNHKVLMMNMPLGAGVLIGFLFSIFPTRRRGLGYADKAPDYYEADPKSDQADKNLASS